ncbi:hypothetical protein CPLU01_16010 [Colletotrichum plurivorum]|uniref:Uncharacterized protein n=1 Tax=Colletotrichum plurivorum TaxID=2175906 RepID=A0A8H6J265_9PEZI|nr:hypothetical protein CPLU01_16010 [Colletotrichum plurivorum]
MRFETLNTNIINGTERMFRLDYSTSPRFACPPNSTVAAKDISTWEQIVFYLDPESTRLPDFASVASSCPLPVTNFGFTDITWTNYGERCMKMTPTRQSDPCGLKLDAEDLANRRQAAMLEFVACSKGTWPDPEGRLGPRFCNAESSSSAGDFSGKVLVLSVLLGIIVMYSM